MAGSLLVGVETRVASGGFASPSAALLGAATEPLQSGLTGVRQQTANWWYALTHLTSLTRENAALRQQLEAGRLQAEQLAEARREAHRLRQLVGLQTGQAGEAVSARVIGRGPSPWFQVLDLDQGRRAGVAPGAAVVAPQGLVGQVYNVSPGRAKVLCLADRLGRVGARVAVDRAREVVGVCEGDGGELTTLTYPDPTADVRQGDAVVTSGQQAGSALPPGILIGHVATVERHTETTLLRLTIVPAVDPRKVEEALILRPNDDDPPGGTVAP